MGICGWWRSDGNRACRRLSNPAAGNHTLSWDKMTPCRTRSPEPSWAPIASRGRSGRARWARSSRGSTPGSTAGSRSRSSARSTATAPSCARGSCARARAVAAISHPNVVQVFATGTFDERPYIAMELLDGIDLGIHRREARARSTRCAAAHAVLDAAQGLAAAAKAGLIHRDVKPSNLVLLSDGRGQGHRLRARQAGRSGRRARAHRDGRRRRHARLHRARAGARRGDRRARRHLRARRHAVLPARRDPAVPHRQAGRGQVPQGRRAPPAQPAAGCVGRERRRRSRARRAGARR